MDTIRRQPPRSQKDTMASGGIGNNNINNTNSSSSSRERPPPPSRSWPLLPLLAVVLCVGFFGARMWPPSKYMNLADPFKTWDPHDKVSRHIHSTVTLPSFLPLASFIKPYPYICLAHFLHRTLCPSHLSMYDPCTHNPPFPFPSISLSWVKPVCLFNWGVSISTIPSNLDLFALRHVNWLNM